MLNKGEYQLVGCGPWQSRELIYGQYSHLYHITNGLYSMGMYTLLSGEGIIN
jgi:hypothetical protein